MYDGPKFEKHHCKDFPDSIRDILKLLKGEHVKIILKCGECEFVTIKAVIGDLLVAIIKYDKPGDDGYAVDKCKKEKFKFVDIGCICAVIADCEDIVDDLFKGEGFCD